MLVPCRNSIAFLYARKGGFRSPTTRQVPSMRSPQPTPFPEEAIDTERLYAELKNGVLALHLPKSEKVKPRRIKVKCC